MLPKGGTITGGMVIRYPKAYKIQLDFFSKICEKYRYKVQSVYEKS